MKLLSHNYCLELKVTFRNFFGSLILCKDFDKVYLGLGSVELVDVSDNLPLLKRSQGLLYWKVLRMSKK